MSELDTKALRALVDAVRAEGRDAGYVGCAPHMHWTELAEQIAALLDAADERDALRARVAELDGEVGRLREAAQEFSSYVHPETLSMNCVRADGTTWYGLTPEYVEGARELHGQLLAAITPAAPKNTQPDNQS